MIDDVLVDLAVRGDSGPGSQKARKQTRVAHQHRHRLHARHDVRHLAVGELATPPALEAGDRRFESCSQTLRGGGAVVLASLMSSRPWVQIPPARLQRGRSSDGHSARLSGERPPVRARPPPLWPSYRGKHSGS